MPSARRLRPVQKGAVAREWRPARMPGSRTRSARMPTLYIANKNYSSWSLRPWILMRELDIPFEEKLVPFAPGSNWGAFRDFSPNGKVPCLVDGDTTVWDSLAITEYLAERHPRAWPSHAKARAFARCAAA